MVPKQAQEPGPMGPTTAGERIVALDVLRGFAVLGILVMNIQSFSMVGAAYINPLAYLWGERYDANYWIWLASHMLTDQKFMAIFSMLFGAGIVLMWERSEAKGRPFLGLHYRRMGWLILFGLLHAHLLWFGDILFVYGVCGLLVVLFRKLRPRTLIVLGVLSLAVTSALYVSFGLSLPYWPAESLQEFRNSWQPGPELVAEEVAAYRGSWLQQMPYRVRGAVMMETFVFAIWSGWRAGGLMLIGMALYKLGVFSAARSRALYWGLVGAALLAIPVVLLGVERNFATGWGPDAMFLGGQYNFWASVPVGLGWVGLVMLACKSDSPRRAVRPLAAVGQMALTNYLLQTIICTTIFYGHGLGLFGQVGRAGQLGIVFAIWAAQLALSPIWLRHFRFGPFEWLWRSLSYMKRQPFRRREPLPALSVA